MRLPTDLRAAERLIVGEIARSGPCRCIRQEGPGSCTSCHSEHEGDTQPNRASQQFCSDCHESLDTRLSDTDLGNAHDFGLGHPGFKAQIFTEFKQDKARRISCGQSKEVSGLIFPHDIHLDPESGVTKMAMRLGKAGGYGAVLECSDCHTPTGDRITFEQVNMEDNCESCHSLVYDRVGSTFRTLQHGDVDQMLADLRAMDRVARRPIVTGRKRPDRFQQGGLTIPILVRQEARLSVLTMPLPLKEFVESVMFLIHLNRH